MRSAFTTLLVLLFCTINAAAQNTESDTLRFDDGSWYVAGYAPVKPEPTREEIQALRSDAYKAEVDPITCHIQRLGDEEQTAEVIAEIAALVEERKAKVEEIKARYPYPVELVEKIEELPVVEEATVSETERLTQSTKSTKMSLC